MEHKSLFFHFLLWNFGGQSAAFLKFMFDKLFA